jgi:amino acid permease
MNNLYLLNKLTIKDLLTKKTQGTHTYIGKLYQLPNEEIASVVHKIFQNIEMTKAFFNTFTQDYQNLFGQNYYMPQTKHYKTRKRQIRLTALIKGSTKKY